MSQKVYKFVLELFCMVYFELHVVSVCAHLLLVCADPVWRLSSG